MKVLRIKLSKAWRREAGDTLIEVTIALSILSMVLISSSVIAADAFRTGQTARERTAIAMAAQGQLEAVRSFRDNNSWDKFLNGGELDDAQDGGSGSGMQRHNGMLVRNATTNNCRVTSPCIHMKAGGASTFLPEGGFVGGPVNTSYIEMVVTPEAGPNPDNVVIRVNYGFSGLSGGNYTGHLTSTFTNLRAGPPPTPIPVQLPCNVGSTDIILVIDTSSSMEQEWQNGNTREEEGKRVAKQFIERALGSAAGNRLAVVGFSDDGRIYADFSTSVSGLKSTIDGLPTINGTNYQAGMEEAQSLLGRARPNTNRTVVFISDGRDQDEARHGPVVMDMIEAYPSNTSLYSVGITPGDYDTTLLENMPTNGGFYSDAKSPKALERAYESIAGAITCN